MREITAKDPIYQADIVCLVGGSEKDVDAYLTKKHGTGYAMYNKDNECSEPLDDDNNDGLQFHVNGADKTFYVWISRPDMGLLYHEVMHLVFDVLVDRGIAYADECEDAFCYWGGDIFQQLARQIFAVTPKKEFIS